MSRKRGMSRDEKLLAMQELMMESNEIWTLGMLEKECPKKKGITAMSVKEILQELCDNDLVSFEKIGSGNFYWCFPSEAYNRRKVTEEKYLKQIAEMEKEITQLEDEIAELAPGREDCEERSILDSEIEDFGQKLAEIQKEAAKYEKLNPEGLKRTQEQTKIALDAANRWTDNIFTVRSWAVKLFNCDKKTFDQQFNIPEDFDYLE